MSDNSEVRFHPVDPATTRQPYRALAALRRHCPVARLEHAGLPPVTLVTRYEDARHVYRDYKSFGNIGFYPSLDVYALTPEDQRTIIDIDPPRHTAVRRLNLLAMKPAAIDAVAPRITDAAEALVADIVANGGGELVGALAVPLPADAIAAVLGIPIDDAQLVHDWVATLFSEPAETALPGRGSPLPNVDVAFDAYIADQIEARRSKPQADDAIARMVAFRHDDGTTFTDDELRVHIRTMLLAGNETTTSLISNAIFRLLTVPRAQERVRADDTLVGPFIEECLRLDAPLTQFPRRCLATTAIGDVGVNRDDVISISIQSANRDELVWGGDADVFDIDRFTTPHPDHLSFGLGVHFCIGAYLARTTATIALRSLLERTGQIELAPGYEFDRVWFFEFWRPKRLDVNIQPA